MFPVQPKVALGLLGLLSLSSAAPTVELEKRAEKPGCTTFKFPVTAKANNLDIQNIPTNFSNPVVLEAFIVQNAETLAGAAQSGAGTSVTQGTFMMSAIYCKPLVTVAKRANTVQYLQHAITMRKEYWNGLTYPVGFQGDTYSYMDVARRQGYATFAMDNLGNGDSEHPDPIMVTQQPIQVETIHQVLLKLRAGTIGGPVGTKKFSKIIYAGHSYGSICGNGIATHHPTDVDAFILTGYSARFDLGAGPLAAGIPIPAKLVSPRFAALDPGYLAQSLESGRKFGLYTNPNSLGGFAPGAPVVDFDNEGTGSIGELATLLYGVGPADNYKGHVYVLTGKNDAIACNVPPVPNCFEGPKSLPARAGAFFPNAADYTYHIPLKTGHDANMHYTSPNSFKLIMEYLDSKGF